MGMASDASSPSLCFLKISVGRRRKWELLCCLVFDYKGLGLENGTLRTYLPFLLP